MVSRTTTLIDSVIQRCRSIGSKVGVMDIVARDIDRVLAELKASSDDLAVVEASGGFMLSGGRMLAGALNVADSTPTIVPHSSETFDDATWVDLVADNTIITIPAGITRVVISCVFRWDAAALGARENRILKNGSTVVAIARYCATATGLTANGPVTTGVINVSPGDTFKHEATQTSGGNLFLFGAFMAAFAVG